MRPSPVFPNYMQMQPRIPPIVWHVLRFLTVSGALALCVALFIRPLFGLMLWWGILVPSLPLIWFVAPGLWRNVCPLAASNQVPRFFGFSRGLTLPRWLKEYYYVIGIVLFFVLASARKLIFNQNGPATALLILSALVAAFIGGLIFKGKSGWCSSLCPLLPVQRLYGQTPFMLVRNSHCAPCVGCAKNCYDFNPGVAYLADLDDGDGHYKAYRRFFAGAFPGFILAFFTLPSPPAISPVLMYLLFVLFMLTSVGMFFALEVFVKGPANRNTSLFATMALNYFYWFTAPIIIRSLNQLFLNQFFHLPLPPVTVWVIRLAVFGLSVAWLVRTNHKEELFHAQKAGSQAVSQQMPAAQSLTAAPNAPEVTILPGDKHVAAQVGQTLLEICERNDLPIEVGCRMGMCGADPLAIHSGMEQLSPVSDEERATIERLGLAPNTRMACCARVQGPVSMSLQPERKGATSTPVCAELAYNPSVKHVIVIGNGIAGVTAADFIRRNHPDCEIHLIGREKHALYNRMAIARLIYGRSAMQGLYLMPESWYDERKITCWINTAVVKIDRSEQQVVLAPGEMLRYDRLVLATGSSSFVPPIEGFGLQGGFVLREADDAMQIRTYAQAHGCRTAVVAGGGLLGLEAAYALHKLGLHVAVLERSDRLLTRQLDRQGSQMLRTYLEKLGLEIVTNAETAALHGDAELQRLLHDKPELDSFFYSKGRVAEVRLKDGRALPCDLYLLCAGIRSNVQLAQEAGLTVNRGIVVDDGMRTSDPAIFAVGDAAEYQGEVHGLWPIAVNQAEVAALNALGGERVYQGNLPVTLLKVVGVDLASIGRFEPASPGEVVIALEDCAEQRYRKLVIAQGKIVGAILLGYPHAVAKVTACIKEQRDVTGQLVELQAGNWDVL